VVEAVDSLILRQLWTVIEDTHIALLLNLNDAELVDQLLREFAHQRTLTAEEMDLVSSYLYSRLGLIRDLASTQLAS